MRCGVRGLPPAAVHLVPGHTQPCPRLVVTIMMIVIWMIVLMMMLRRTKRIVMIRKVVMMMMMKTHCQQPLKGSTATTDTETFQTFYWHRPIDIFCRYFWLSILFVNIVGQYFFSSSISVCTYCWHVFQSLEKLWKLGKFSWIIFVNFFSPGDLADAKLCQLLMNPNETGLQWSCLLVKW